MEWLRTEASATLPKQAVGRTSATHRSEKRIHPGTRRHFGRGRPKRRVFQLLLLAQETGRANSTSSWRRLLKPRWRPRVKLGRPAFAHARAKDPGSYPGASADVYPLTVRRGCRDRTTSSREPQKPPPRVSKTVVVPSLSRRLATTLAPDRQVSGRQRPPPPSWWIVGCRMRKHWTITKQCCLNNGVGLADHW
jgi:hypothetical protein